jgi:hypothetical protein
MPDPGKIPTANDLRFAGEGADAIRDQPAFLVVAKDGKPEVVTRENLEGRTPLMEFETQSRGPGMRSDVKVQFVLNGEPYTKPIPNFDKADAVFLTQSAVAKFILPYYMRFKSGSQVQALENRLFNPDNVVAAFHIPGSFTFAVVSINKISGECECELFEQEDEVLAPA